MQNIMLVFFVHLVKIFVMYRMEVWIQMMKK